MTRTLLALFCLSASFWSEAITYYYGNLDLEAKTCAITGWSGLQPSNGVLEIPETYSEGGTTYLVTAIAPHALDNLTTVTNIILSSGITTIGKLSCTGSVTTLGALMNFDNCPNLTRFGVSSGNPGFDASPTGELRCLNKTILVKVPQKVVTDNGSKFNIPPSVTTICEDALTGNTTIKTLGLPPKLTFDRQYPGYGMMTKLQEFTVSGNDRPINFTIDNGIVYSKDMATIIAFPPCKTLNSVNLPEGMKKIGDKAFANTLALYKIGLPESLSETGREAFAGCGITDIVIPGKMTKMAPGTFKSCPRLTSVTINSHVALPADFARDCKMLTRVDTRYPPSSLGDNAFKDCQRLESFPFSGETDMAGDSIFAGCAFREVVFRESAMPQSGIKLGNHIFADNPALEEIDMSAVDTESAASGYGMFSIGVMFVNDCPKLKSVNFPARTTFIRHTDGILPTFGIDPAVEKIILRSFGAVPSADILYYTSGKHSPKVYMLTSGSHMHRWPLEYFFSPQPDSSCTPTIYCEGYTMELEQGHKSEYATAGAFYYIPGGTWSQYRYARDKGRGVMEMFGFYALSDNGTLTLDITGNIPGLRFDKVTVNGENVGLPGTSGKIQTPIPLKEVENVTVEYTHNNVAMKTIYPGNFFQSGIEEVDTDINPAQSCGIQIDSRNVNFSCAAIYTVQDLQGRTHATGTGTTADLTPLPAGLYIISARPQSGATPYTHKKINLL